MMLYFQASGLGSIREAMYRVAQTFGMVLDGEGRRSVPQPGENSFGQLHSLDGFV